MKSKRQHKIRAIKLRKQGLSYTEIKTLVPVSKSTLSLWLGKMKVNKKAKDILWNKLREAQEKGARVKHTLRLEKERKIKEQARREIGRVGKDGLFLSGLMLYWAEGSKIRDENISQQVVFTNSDPLMCKFYLKWLKEALKIGEQELAFSVYIHETYKNRGAETINYWAKELSISKKRFKKVSFTKTPLSAHNRRRNRRPYFGQLRIRVRKSVDLNRKIEGWLEGVCIQAGVKV